MFIMLLRNIIVLCMSFSPCDPESAGFVLSLIEIHTGDKIKKKKFWYTLRSSHKHHLVIRSVVGRTATIAKEVCV